MLEKSLASPADCIAYDLEDAVSPGKKAEARRMVADFIDVGHTAPWSLLARGIG